MSRSLNSFTESIALGQIIDASGLAPVSTNNGITLMDVSSASQYYDKALLPDIAKSRLWDANYQFASPWSPTSGSLPVVSALVPPATLTGVRSFGKGISNNVGVVTFSASGRSIVTFGVSPVSVGVGLASNGTNQVGYYAATDSTIRAQTSGNGLTFTDSALTTPSTFSGLTNQSFPSYQGTDYNNINNVRGFGRYFYGDNSLIMGFYAGARYVLAARNGANYTATISTNGTTFGGDATTAILGATTIAASTNGFWYRNGNNSFFVLGTAARRTTDGGVTWAAITNPPSSTDYFYENTTAPAKLTAIALASTTLRVSADSGATWTSRTLPAALDFGDSLAYLGSIGLVVKNGSIAYVTTNDFAAVGVLPTPAGITGVPTACFADAFRLYVVYSSGQIATTTDGTTFTVRNIANYVGNLSEPIGAVALSSSVVMLYSSSDALVSSDGGVTWRAVLLPGSSGAKRYFAAAPEGTGYILGGTGNGNTQVINTADVGAPGGFKASLSSVNGQRTGATAYARVA